MAGFAVLSWAGKSLKDLGNEIKGGLEGFIDDSSSWLADFLNRQTPTPANVRIAEIAARIKEIHDRQAEIQNLINEAIARGDSYASLQGLIMEGTRLSDEEDELRAELNMYVTGEKGAFDK